MSTDISIVVVNYNTLSLLRDCLKSIEVETGALRVETIVVDNASPDQSAAMVATEFPAAVLIANSENLGFSRGNNQGFAVAKGRYVFILNPDTVVLPNCLRELHDFMEKNPAVGVCGPWIRDASLTNPLERWEGRFPRVRLPMFYVNSTARIGQRSTFVHSRLGKLLATPLQLPYVDLDAPVQVDWVLNAASFIRRSIVTRPSLMDETFWIGTEEIEFCCTYLRPLEMKHFIVPRSQIIHFVGKSYFHKLAWAIQLARLSQAAVHFRRTEVFGSFWARLDSLVALVDHLALAIAVGIRGVFRPNNERTAMRVIYLSQVITHFMLMIGGARYALKVDRDFREWIGKASRPAPAS